MREFISSSQRAGKFLESCTSGAKRSIVPMPGIVIPKIVFSFLFLACFFQSFSQFIDVTDSIGVDDYESAESTFGNGLSFYDINMDGWDDLTYSTSGSGVVVYLNEGGNMFQQDWFDDINGELKHPTWIDFDNDGDNDFYVSRWMGYPYLFENDGNFNFTDISYHLPCTYEYPATACVSWGDYDNDSYPDLYMANYHVASGTESWLFRNLGNGYFEETALSLGVDNGIHAAFQPLWIDYDMDRDVDLFLVNDRHHGTHLYKNNGNSTFTDIADSVGFYIEEYCMGLNASDFDHDGDFDFYITNTFAGNQFLINNNGIFTEVADSLGSALYDYAWGCLFIDDDNSTWEDLVVMCDVYSDDPMNFYLQNNQGNSFTVENEMFDCITNIPSFCIAKGDLENDGFSDMTTMNTWPNEVRVWNNQSEENNYIKMRLEGTISNRNAIGAIVKCYSNGVMLMRAITSGDSYMSQDSQNIIFGLGQSASVDSLTIDWPSGWTDLFLNLDVNQSYLFTEGETFGANNDVQTVMVCSGDSVLLSSPVGDEYEWNIGGEMQTLITNVPGFYSVAYFNEFGFSSTASFEVIEHPVVQIESIVTMVPCHGGNNGCIEVQSDFALNSVEWSDDVEANSRCDLMAGFYSATVEDAFGCEQFINIEITEPEVLNISVADTIVCHQQFYTPVVHLSGGTGDYSVNWENGSGENYSAGIHVVNVLDDNGCSATDSLQIDEYPEIIFSYVSDTICEGEFLDLIFSIEPVEDNYFIDWFGKSPEMISNGDHNINIVSSNGCTTEAIIHVEESSAMSLNFEIDYAVGSDPGSVEIAIDGGMTPYTIMCEGLMVTDSLSGLESGEYDVVVTDAAGCIIEDSFKMINLGMNEYGYSSPAFPNPFVDVLNVVNHNPQGFSIVDESGRIVHRGSSVGSTLLDVTSWSAGNYFLVMNDRIVELVKLK